MTQTAKNTDTGQTKKNNKIIVIVVILVVLVIALVAVIAFLLGRGQNSGDSVTAESENAPREVAGSIRTVLDESSAEDMINEMREEVVEGMFECQMSMTWTFPNGSAESQDAYVANSTNNTHPIYFDVYLKDTEELLYSSPVLPVGSTLTNFKLDQELPAGDYQATVMYKLLKDAESQEEISSAGFVITIHVLN